MSLSKRELDKINEANSPDKCPDCGFDWDSKFLIPCERHSREMQEADAEADYWAELNAHYSVMDF